MLGWVFMTISNVTFLTDHTITRKDHIDKTSSNTWWIFLLSGYELHREGVGHVSGLVRYQTGAQTALNSSYSLLNYKGFSRLNTECLFTSSTCFLSHVQFSVPSLLGLIVPCFQTIFPNLFHLQFHWDSCDCRTVYQQNIQSPKSKPVSEALTERKKSDQIRAVSAWLEKWWTFSLQFSNKRSAPGGKSATRWKVCERCCVKFRTSENHKMMHSCYLWDIFRCYFELWQREHTTALLKWVTAVISWFNSQHV